MKKLSIIYTSWNNKEYLDLSLWSLEKNTDLSDKEVIVVDDGSTDGTSEMVKEKYNHFVTLITLGENMGIPNALNLAVYHSSAPYMMYMDSDIVFPPDWEKALKPYVKENNFVCADLIEPINCVSEYGFIQKDLGKNVKDFKYDDFVTYEKSVRKKKIQNVPLTPFIMSKTKFMKVGGYDMMFSPLPMCDIDFYTKLSLDNLKFIKTSETHLYHFSGKGARERDDNKIDIKKFRLIESVGAKNYIIKWGFNPSKQYPTGIAKGINFGKNFVRMFGR